MPETNRQQEVFSQLRLLITVADVDFMRQAAAESRFTLSIRGKEGQKYHPNDRDSGLVPKGCVFIEILGSAPDQDLRRFWGHFDRLRELDRQRKPKTY